MKDYNEMTQRVLERRDRYEAEQKQRHQRMRRRVITSVCAFVAVFVGLSAWLAVDTEARAAVQAAWKKTFDGERTTYTFTSSGTFNGFPEVELTWLPEGYELVEVEIVPYAQTGKDRKWYSYENSETETTIGLCITSIEDVPEISVSMECETEEVSVNGKPAEFVRQKTPDGTKWWLGHLMWADEEQGVYYMLVSGLVRQSLTVDDFVKMAESMVVVG